MDLNNLLKQAQKMQRNIQAAQDELANTEYTGTAGGAVTITINGANQVLSVDLKEEVLEKENKEMLQDMIMTAFNNAMEDATNDRNEKMGSITGGVNVPGMF